MNTASTQTPESLGSLICCALIALCLVACHEDESLSEPAPNPLRYEFEGHTYVSFKRGSYRSGIAHDPRCHCHFDELIRTRQEELDAAKESADPAGIKKAEYLLKRAFERAKLIYGNNTQTEGPIPRQNP